MYHSWLSLKVVQLRNDVIESLEMDRLREAEEDQVCRKILHQSHYQIRLEWYLCAACKQIIEHFIRHLLIFVFRLYLFIQFCSVALYARPPSIHHHHHHAEHQRASRIAHGQTWWRIFRADAYQIVKEGEEKTEGGQEIGQTEENRCGQGKHNPHTHTNMHKIAKIYKFGNVNKAEFGVVWRLTRHRRPSPSLAYVYPPFFSKNNILFFIWPHPKWNGECLPNVHISLILFVFFLFFQPTINDNNNKNPKDADESEISLDKCKEKKKKKKFLII